MELSLDGCFWDERGGIHYIRGEAIYSMVLKISVVIQPFLVEVLTCQRLARDIDIAMTTA